MSNFQQRNVALTGSACPEKATELFYVSHPKAPRDVLGPFLTYADAECGRVVLRSADATVSSHLVAAIDGITRLQAENNGSVCRAFAAASTSEVGYG
ncbi:hypothetical protein [Pseudomonas kurunegalensis]|uniref:hypothetical protein n=1 Tax=Pseudomonas kurunegalensis TaxID=485880 RepID=UPI0021194617|nr:hypothetical protein [Pseudomonas kurunegalensis]